jgi:hypothetical protein
VTSEGVANLSGTPTLRGSRRPLVAGPLLTSPLTQELIVSAEPALTAEALLDQLRARFERLCHDVTDAVNAAPAGQVINASEEKVRDLLADFRRATFEAALQLRTDAAQAAFPPSSPPPDGSPPAEQGTR